MNTYDSIYNNYLAHHGIKGQKWGVRRYQNPDGSLTEEGKKRYYGYASKLEDIADKTVRKYMYEENGREKYEQDRRKSLAILGEKNRNLMLEAAKKAYERTSSEQRAVSERTSELVNERRKQFRRPRLLRNKKMMSESSKELNKLDDIQSRINMDIIESMISSVHLDKLPKAQMNAGMRYIADTMGYIAFDD